MSYRVEVTSVKPTDVEWFNAANPTSFESYKSWAATLPGLVGMTATRPDTNTIVRIYEFEDQAAYTAYTNAHTANADDQLRQAYNNQNGITIALRFLDA